MSFESKNQIALLLDLENFCHSVSYLAFYLIQDAHKAAVEHVKGTEPMAEEACSKVTK